jgi:threonine 3-dehydrogenase
MRCLPDACGAAASVGILRRLNKSGVTGRPARAAMRAPYNRRQAPTRRATSRSMTQMMRALVKREAAPGIWMEEVPVPEIGPNDVLVKLEKTAICGTDLHIYKWDAWSQRTIRPGLVIGHEFVGRIAELGSAVRGYQVGQRVSAEGHVVCGVCRNCRAGKQHRCPNTVGIGVNRNGAFAEYVAVPASNLWPIPDPIPSELAAFFDP